MMTETAPSLQLSAAAHTDPGRVHDVDQDSALAVIRPETDGAPAGLFVVADGMGGHQAGEVASRLVIETMRRELAWLLERVDLDKTQPLPVFRPDESAAARLQRRLKNAVERANRNRALALGTFEQPERLQPRAATEE